MIQRSAKMDSPENDLPPSMPFRITGFPTLKFKPAGTRDFIDYEGDRSLESLIDFIKAHAKNPIDIPEVKSDEETEAQAPVEAPTATPEPTPEAHDEL